MEEPNVVIAVFADHQGAEAAVKKLASAGIEMKHLSVVGKGYHTDEKVVGFYNVGDRIKFWGMSWCLDTLPPWWFPPSKALSSSAA
jgi:hypothetical protein